MTCKHNIPYNLMCVDCMREDPHSQANRFMESGFRNVKITTATLGDTIEGECTEVAEVKLLEGKGD